MTTGNLVDLFCRSWGEYLKQINRSDGGPHETNFLKLDCSKLKFVLGWKSLWGVEQAVEKTVEWTKVYVAEKDVMECGDRQIKEFLREECP